MRLRGLWFSLAALAVSRGAADDSETEPRAVGRRFGDPHDATPERMLLCHRLHLLPVTTERHSRLLTAGCPLQPSLPKVVKDPPGSVGWTKDKFQSDFDAERARLADAKKNRKPTPAEDDALKALDAKQSELKKLQDAYDANRAARNADAHNADAQAIKDRDDKSAQWQVVADDLAKAKKYDADVAAAEADRVRDALDLKHVDDAKADLKRFEDSVVDAKAKAAGDPKTIEAFDAEIAKRKTQRAKDDAQRDIDEKQARDDAALADSAEKQQRAKDRADRARQREINANELQDTLNRARAARDDAVKRKQVLETEEVERARLKKQVQDQEDALALNRKNRDAEAAERQKRMDDYKNEEPNIARRKKEYEDAEAARVKRAKDRDDARMKREKEAEDEAARLKKAREEQEPPEQRSKRDDEEDCKDKSTDCGSGRCLQKKNDPDSKRCQCQPGDKGKNCEYKGCEYDVADGTGKKKKQRGNQVNGQCVRWRGIYRCTCDKPWHLEVTCRKKDLTPGAGDKEKQVPDSECGDLRRPKNRFKRHTCRLCKQACSHRGRQLEENHTANATSRMLRSEVVGPMEINNYQASCNRRMMENRDAGFMFTMGQVAPIAIPPGQRPREDGDSHKPPHQIEFTSTFTACQELCLERDGDKAPSQTGTGIKFLNERFHCTWLWFAREQGKCYMFAGGSFPRHAVDPPPEQSDNVDMEDDSLPMSGFVAFVAYPRRFVMYRRRTVQPAAAQTYGTHSVVPGSLLSTAHADDATFAFTTALMTHPNCIATADTIREAALSFQDHFWDPDASKMRVTGLNQKINLLPTTWTAQFGTPGAAQQIDVVAPTKVSWKYTLDAEMRVTRVEGLSTKVDESERAYDNEYADIMLGAYFNANGAAMDAGHLIAQQQNPPLFFFNYVPQHYNSNRASSCWWNTEMMVAYLIDEMKCPVEYLVRLDYRQNGIQTPTAMGQDLPTWAATSTVSSNPDLNTYSQNQFICHYRYRPFTMSIDFKITSHVQGTPCMNLQRALQHANMPSMFTIVGDRLRTSRLFAFHTGTPSSPDLTRLFSAATAQHKNWSPTSAASQRMCYAETGNIADFAGIELTYDFFQAFLDYKYKGGYYALSVVGKEDRWSRGDPQNVEGELTHELGGCLQLQSGQLSRGNTNCGRFRYINSATYLDKNQAVLTTGVTQPPAHPGNGQSGPGPLPLSAVSPGTKSLVQGIVVFPSNECLHDGLVPGPIGPQCVIFGLTHGGS